MVNLTAFILIILSISIGFEKKILLFKTSFSNCVLFIVYFIQSLMLVLLKNFSNSRMPLALLCQ